MRYAVVFTPEAQEQLAALYRYLWQKLFGKAKV